MTAGDPDTPTATVRDERRNETATIEGAAGATLRDVLIEHGLSPHGRYAVTNCGGRGLCATCGVRLAGGDPSGDEGPPPEHWHDRLAARFGYPRLSCQVPLQDGMWVRIPDKRVWGRRESSGAAGSGS
jgi:ferredoxin